MLLSYLHSFVTWYVHSFISQAYLWGWAHQIYSHLFHHSVFLGILFNNDTEWVNNTYCLFSAKYSQSKLLQLAALLLVDEPLIFAISCFRSGLPGKADVCDKPSWLCDSQKMKRIDTPVTMTHTWKLLQVPAQKLSSVGLTHQQCRTTYDLWTLLIIAKLKRKKRKWSSLLFITMFSLQ